MPTLSTTRYTKPGTYIAQLIIPRPGNLTAEARICNYVGRGSRFAVGQNLAIRRSFVFDENLTFPTSAPFQSPIAYAADGNKSRPARVFDSITGLALREDQWAFVKIGADYKAVLISPSAFNQNAAYKVDYQSVERRVKDPLPVDNLRSITSIGLNPDRNQFTDFVDFFVPFSFTGYNADVGNSVLDSYMTSVFPDVFNVGLGSAAIDVAASFNHDYNRFYQLSCTAIAGGPGTYQATFSWLARPYSGGNDMAPQVPLHSAEAPPSFTVQQAIPATLVQELELGIKIAFSFTGGQFAVSDKFYFNAVGPGKLEFDSRHQNTNQFLEFSSVVKTGAGTGVVSYASDNTYTGDYNAKFRVKCIASAGGIGSRTASFVWAEYGDELGASGTFSIAEAGSTSASLTQGVKLNFSFGASNFIVSDYYSFEALPPRLFYQAKDDRVLKISIGSAQNLGADTGVVVASFSTSTPEGGFGSFTTEMNLLSGVNKKRGDFTLPDGVKGFVRNMMQGNINGTSYISNDKFEGAVTSEDTFDWSLTRKTEEIRETTAFLVDTIGTVTGTAGTKYIILDNVYTAGSVEVTKVSDSSAVSYAEITNTRFVAFISDPAEAVRIKYEYRGEEPSPGQLYYLTATYLRPTSLYNNPTQILDIDDGRRFLAPAASDNHLYIMNDIAFEQGIQGAYYTQAFDADGDGIITRTDIQAALEAHNGLSRATDLCLLASSEALPDALQSNELGNDPFEKREQMFWYGAPIGTPIGNIDTPNTLVYLAKRTLQTSPTSAALGTRVLVAPTRCTRTIVLPNKLSQVVDLDGSFVAGATSALVNSFADPATTILRRSMKSFDSIQTYSEPENLVLGAASIVYMSDQGSSVYRYEEDITVHDLDEIFQLISATVQKHFVVRVVRNNLDAGLIGVVTPSAQAAIALIASTLGTILIGLRSRGLIADYQDTDGNVRDFDPNADVVVTRDTTSLTSFNFLFAFWIRTPIKRLFGLYAVNTNDFGVNNIR